MINNLKTIAEKSAPLAKDFINFNNQCTSPYHAVAVLSKRLTNQGFVELKETESWQDKIKKGGKYYTSRNGSGFIAFTVGEKFTTEQAKFKIIGTHLDSCCLRLAPKSKHEAFGYQQAAVECYGGGLWHTWFDRELKIGGRVVINKDGKLQYKLYDSEGPVALVPNLCIHLSDTRKGNDFKFNKEGNFKPIFSTKIMDELDNEDAQESKDHYKGLFLDISKKLGCNVEDIVDFDLCFADNLDSEVIGFNKEFIVGPRIDNLVSSWAAAFAIGADLNLGESADINVAAMFDHEEVGSSSTTGAKSDMLPSLMSRIFESLGGNSQNALKAAYQKSFFISADMAHAIHPNYSSKHQSNHRVALNKGVIIKINANTRYCTNAISGAIAKTVAKNVNVPIQEFIVRQDSACGSTIGPMLSTQTGINALDVGCGQLAMHSIRESCGTLDTYYYTEFFKGFYANPLPEVDMNIE